MAAPLVITVSELRAACLDPAWRERWRRGEKPLAFPGRARPGFPVQGALFHTLAEQFIGWLTSKAPAPAQRATEGPELWKALYDRFAVKHLDALVREEAVPSAHHLSRALSNFCDRLAALRAEAGAQCQSWRDLFLTQEYALHQVPVETPTGMIMVSGRPDAVRQAFGRGLEVIDYKLSRGSSLKEDLIQVAAYAHLLSTTKPGLRFSGVLEYYEPALHVVPATERDLEVLWDEVILPALGDLARLAEARPSLGAAGNAAANAGEKFQKPTVAEKSLTQPTAAADGTEALDLDEDPESAAKIERTYASFKLKVKVIGCQIGPQLIRHYVVPGEGVKVVSLANRAEDLQVALASPLPPLIQAAPGFVTIDFPRERTDGVYLVDMWPVVEAKKAAPLEFPVGLQVDGRLLYADFAEPNTCHALVAGAAGSGKSEFLKSMVATLIRRNSHATLRLVLVDPKAVTFTGLADCPHLLGPVMTDLGETLAFLEEAVSEMESRYRKLAAAGHENLAHRGADAAMPYWLIVFDEFADLIMSGKKEKQAFESLVARLAQKGRAAGIHLVLATQRPDRNIVSGLIKANLPLKVCLRVTTAVNSQIVLDAPGAEKLVGHGDLLCDRGGAGPIRAQSPYIRPEELRQLCH